MHSTVSRPAKFDKFNRMNDRVYYMEFSQSRRAVVVGNMSYSGEEPPFFYALSEQVQCKCSISCGAQLDSLSITQGPSDAETVAEAFTECEFSSELLTDASDSAIDAAITKLAENTK